MASSDHDGTFGQPPSGERSAGEPASAGQASGGPAPAGTAGEDRASEAPISAGAASGGQAPRGPAGGQDFTARALAEIDGLHCVLQAWFRAEGAQDPALVLRHFDPGYTMITPGGRLLTFGQFQAALPGFWGSRPGLVMEISQETLLHAGQGFALMTYIERQHLNGAVTDRFSSVLMLAGGDGAPLWRHLQETMIA